MSDSNGVSLISTLVTSSVTLGSGGYASMVTVTSTGTVAAAPTMATGYGYQVIIGSNDATLINDGLISGGTAPEHINAGRGVSLASGYLLNAGTIFGGNANYNFGGAGVVQSGGTLLNTGLIGGGTYLGTGIGSGATADGLDISGGYAKNDGRIVNGVILNGGTVVNAGYVRSVKLDAGLFTNNSYVDALAVLGGTLVNAGTLVGVRVGLPGYSLTALVINTGTITSNNGDIGFYAADGGTFFNGGFIGGGLNAGTGAVDLILAPDSSLDGSVTADTRVSNRLDLASGTSAGSVNLVDFSGFSTIAFDVGATWTLDGTATKLADGQRITGFGLGDTLVLEGVSDTAKNYVSGTGLELGSDTIDITGSFTTASFTITTDGTNTTITAPCFCAGTRIRTPGGEVAVENLAIGDAVETAFAGVQRIKWIGRRSYGGRFIAGNPQALPVCIKAGAIADGIPVRDLFVSPDHAICEGGVLIHACRLLNGVSIVQAEAVERVSYFHIELEGHHILFAEGCPAESFWDADCRQRFANAHDYAALYGDTEPGRPCLPLVQGGFHLENIRRRLAERAGVVSPALPPGPMRGNLDEAGPERLRGWAQDVSAPEVPVVLAVTVDGKACGLVLANEFRADLREAGLGLGCHAFSLPLPPGAGQVEVRRASDGAVLMQTPLNRAA